MILVSMRSRASVALRVSKGNLERATLRNIQDFVNGTPPWLGFDWVAGDPRVGFFLRYFGFFLNCVRVVE
jgi:hypothetical protein